jgi:hypothetical protein
MIWLGDHGDPKPETRNQGKTLTMAYPVTTLTWWILEERKTSEIL